MRLRDHQHGQVSCWQNEAPVPESLQNLAVPGLQGATDLSLNLSHLCGLVSEKIKCLTWTEPRKTRNNQRDEIRLSSEEEVVVGLPPMKSLSGNCGLSTSGEAWCWDWIRREDSEQPKRTQLLAYEVKHLPKLRKIWSESPRHFCANSSEAPDQPPTCAISYIHTGPPGSIDEHTPHDGDTLRWDGNGVARLDRALTPLRDIAWGEHHQCVITVDGSIQCWGSIAYGEAGKLPPARFSEQAIEVDLKRALGQYSCATLRNSVN